MAQGWKVLAAALGPPPSFPYSRGGDEEFAESERTSAELASSADLSEARVLLGMVRGLPPRGFPGAAAG
jgi:hypothetical protein